MPPTGPEGPGPDGGDPDMLAGEMALGVLEGEALAEAQRRMADRAFADEVAWWRHRLGALSENAGSVEPSDSVWRAIDLRLNADDHQGADIHRLPPPRENRGPSRWSIATALAGLGAAAAAIALYVSTPGPVPVAPPAEAPAPQPVLIAQLQGEDGVMRLASVVDPASGRLSLSIEGLDAQPGTAPELWVVPQDGAPVSLGLIPQAGSTERSLSAEQADLLVPGATLAVTFEDETTAPHQAPTPPIVLAGTLDRV
jgi:anti-sigma-K factor RskA